MNILLLGKDGQVGKELARTLLPLGHVHAIGRRELNLENLSHLKQFLQKTQFNLIVNAAAYTAVDKAESDANTAYIINEQVTRTLAEYAQMNNALMVHYSTDYVFDGEKKEPYLESDRTNPQNIYGASKRAGEQAILNSGCRFLIFRTSWVFSAYGHNFITTILKLAQEKETLRIVADQYGAPTSAEFIADVTALAIADYRRGKIVNGIYHLTASGHTSWHGLALYAVEKARLNGATLTLKQFAIDPIATDGYPLPAKRPKSSLLDLGALSNALEISIPHWQVDVDRMIHQLSDMEFFA